MDNGAGQTVTATVTISVNQAQTTSTSIGSDTTTTSSSTTVAPEEPTITYFFSGVSTINLGETTYLWAYFSGSSATVDNGIGALPNYTSIDISPSVTTTYTLTVSNSLGHTVTATATVTVASPTTTSTTTTTTQPPVSTTVPTSTTTSPSTTTTTSTTTTVPSDGNYVTIFTSPSSTAARLGETVTVSVSGRGKGTISYQWMLDDVDIDGATSSTYQAGIAGTYKARMTSTLNGQSVSATSQGAVIRIVYGTITAQPHDSVITDGDINYMNVGFSVPLDYVTSRQWFRDDVEVSGATGLSINAQAAGRYRLRITTSNNGATHVQWTDYATVTVLPKPTVRSFSASPSTILTGTSTTLDADFSDGTGVITPGNVAIVSGIGVSVSPTVTTTYTLTVTNGAGWSITRTSKVIVTTGTLTASANGSTASRYQYGSSVVLNDGRVLVFGGPNPDAVATDIYDPATNRFTRVGDMHEHRGSIPGVLLPNGKVLAVGGQYLGPTGNYTARSTAELFDPSTGTWSYTGTPLTSRRRNFAILLSNGKVLVGGGANASGSILSSVEIYDPATESFSSAAPMPAARTEMTAIRLTDGSVLVVGGHAGGPGTDTAFIYDVGTNTWRTLSSHMNYGRYGAVAVRLNDGRVVIGGGRYTSIAESHLELFNPVTETFVQAVDLPAFLVGRYGMTAHLLPNGKVAYFGGNDGNGDDLDEIVVFDPASSTLTTEATHLSVSRFLQSSVVLNDGRIFVLGGNYWNATNADIFSP